jgi:hypothetical protein
VVRLMTDFYGNYTLQDMIEVASRLREAAVALEEAKQLKKKDADAARGLDASGLDVLGQPPPPPPPPPMG